MESATNYIDWLLSLETTLYNAGIDLSNYDEFHINEAIRTIEEILVAQSASTISLDEAMINAYMENAIRLNPAKKEYYETISYYVKRRLSINTAPKQLPSMGET